MSFKKAILVLIYVLNAQCDNFTSINLPEEHLPFYFRNFKQQSERCKASAKCPYKEHLNVDKCWGYETDCTPTNQYSHPRCPGDHKGWVKSKEDQISTFYTQADFGYVKQQQQEMKLLCEPLFIDDSSLECSEHMRFCRGRNLMINFTSLRDRKDPIRYKMDVLQEGDIGGYCNLRKDLIEENIDHLSPLQSWGPEIRYFTQLQRRPIVEGDCDVVINKPTFIMKIDATVNMYHHFCDFLNLYASQHLNATHPDAFSTDVQILIWETYNYRSAFEDTFQAFTDHPVWDLRTFRGETVCFKNVVFPLLPRMIFGLYYNTPIIYGCESSGLFKAFSEHILHRLEIPFYERRNDKIKVTFLSRDTKYRKITNENKLIKALKQNRNLDVQKVVYNKNMSFKKQLEITRNSDIFIGIHGAGLTHSLFLPDWAVLFEIYNCEDSSCYFDLARLRGVKYITWKNASLITTESDGSYEGGAHAKFVNYSFDVEEFLNLVADAKSYVKNHQAFKKLTQSHHDEL